MTEPPAHIPHPHAPASNPFTKKLGPLPVYVYAGIIIVLGLGYTYYKSRSGGGAPVDATGAASSASDLPAPDTGSGGSDSYGAPVVPVPPVVATTGTTAPTTNLAWSLFIEQKLIADGESPGIVTRALYAYLHGDTLTVAQSGIIQKALRISQPPEGIIPAKYSAPPPKKVTLPIKGNPAPVGTEYTVRKGDSWESVAFAHYGVHGDGPKLQAANGGHGPVFVVGHVIHIPPTLPA